MKKYSVETPDSNIRKELIADAKKYQEMRESKDVWIAEVGWQDWMNDYTEAKEGEEITEAEAAKIDEILTAIWKEATEKEA